MIHLPYDAKEKGLSQLVILKPSKREYENQPVHNNLFSRIGLFSTEDGREIWLCKDEWLANITRSRTILISA
jgi:hypothetical protein